MAGRVIEKGWVVPQGLGIALLVVILGGVGTLYWRIIDKQVEQDRAVASQFREQRDLLIRLDQRLMDKDIRDREETERWEKRFQNMEAWQGVISKDFATIKAKRGVQ